MSQSTPPGSYPGSYPGVQTSYLPPQPKETNVPAVISLVTGILSCVPLISVVAVITGILGLSQAKKPNVGGKGMATAGLILGIVGLLWTIGAGVLLIAGRHAVLNAVNSPAHAVAKQFVADIATGNTTAVLGDCDSGISIDKVNAVITDAKSWGTLTDSTLFASPPVKSSDGHEQSMVAGVAIFANAKKTVSMTVIDPTGSPKVSDFTFTDTGRGSITIPESTTAP